MRDRFSQLTGRCPGSNEQVGAQNHTRTVACQTCNRKVGVNARGVVEFHCKNWFHYLSAGGVSGALEYTGLDSYGYFGFAVRGWGADRVAAHMALPLNELKRLHEFLGSAIGDIEQACASNPAFHAQVKGAGDSMKHEHGPQIIY
jgi:hypothetical protein